MRTLVTGASGFIGSHLVKKLVSRGDDVRCLVRKSSSLWLLDPSEVTLVYGDVMDPSTLVRAVSDCDIVYHIAGLTKSVPADTMWQVNQQGVHHIAAACADCASPPRLVVLSSIAAGGPAQSEQGQLETDPNQPVSKYGVSKLKGEKAAFEFATQVPISIVRAPIVFGEGDLDGLKLFKLISASRLHMLPTWRDHRYSFIHGADLAGAMILVGEEGQPIGDPGHSDGIYGAAAEQNPTYGDYGRMIGKAMGIDRVWVLPSLPMTIRVIGAGSELFARVTGRPQIMNWDKTREALAGSWSCSPSKIQRELGFQTEYPIPQRLRQTVRWYVTNGYLPSRRAPKSDEESPADV
jgi:nucleoside-diphosphate-sugar epimerase